MDIERFVQVFQLPPAMRPYLQFVANDREMALVLALSESPLTEVQVAAALEMEEPDVAGFLVQAISRGLIDRLDDGGVTRYRSATFYDRLNSLAMYENWGDLPAEAREAVIEWDLGEFIERYAPIVAQMRLNPDVYHEIPNRDVLLLDEALAQVDAASEHVVVPCDCRTITMACNRPTEVCIRLDEGARLTLAHGHGRQISKDACKAIVVDADRAGLMHTGLRDWQGRDLFGFCNCCACCCFPIRAGIRLGLAREWPRAHHVAERDLDVCIQCGTCVDRCQFGAFYQDDDGVQFDSNKCWGCGLCATGCPEEAITMRHLADDMESSA